MPVFSRKTSALPATLTLRAPGSIRVVRAAGGSGSGKLRERLGGRRALHVRLVGIVTLRAPPMERPGSPRRPTGEGFEPDPGRRRVRPSMLT